MYRFARVAAVALTAGLGACASETTSHASMPAQVGQSAGGAVLTDARGMTLYTFDRDAGGKSACNGQCAMNWPPLLASANASPMDKYTVVTRDDGARQWAYNSKPLYTWAKDMKPGDTTGDGVNNVWHVARP